MRVYRQYLCLWKPLECQFLKVRSRVSEGKPPVQAPGDKNLLSSKSGFSQGPCHELLTAPSAGGAGGVPPLGGVSWWRRALWSNFFLLLLPKKLSKAVFDEGLGSVLHFTDVQEAHRDRRFQTCQAGFLCHIYQL